MTMTIYHSEKELLDFSEEHIYYEFWMFFRTLNELNTKGEHMAEMETRGMESAKSNAKFEFNTILEAFLIHTRNLMEFFYEGKKKGFEKTDMRVKDFIDDPAKWTHNIGEFTTVKYQDIKDRISQEIEHITSFRKYPNDITKVWTELEIVVNNITKAMSDFKNLCSDKKTHKDVREFEIPNVQFQKPSEPITTMAPIDRKLIQLPKNIIVVIRDRNNTSSR